MTKAKDKWALFVWDADEEWRPVQGFPGYEVSDRGRVRSSLSGVHKRLLKGELDKDGYIRVTLWKERTGRKIHLHRLVALHFVDGRSLEKNFACHRNGNKSDNGRRNLKWATQAENIADKIEHGTHQAGSKHPRASIDDATAIEIKRLLDEIPKYRGKFQEIAARTGASYQVVSGIAHKGTWGHVC